NFDRFTRILASQPSRRDVFRGLAAAAFGGVAIAVAGRSVVADSAANPLFQPPGEISSGALGEEALREQLLAAKAASCGQLGLVAGVIVSTGILADVPPMISRLTGLPIDELEARETAACQTVGEGEPDAEKTTVQLLNEANTAQWLVQIHLGAMDRVLMENPTYRPIAAEGCFAAFFEMHNLNVQAMRDGLIALADEPTLENGKALGQFWTGVLQPHAVAEDETLWDLARSVGDPNLTHSTDLVAAEHQTVDQAIAVYMDMLAAVEAGQADADALIPLAENARIRTELHFGKEEVTVVRPLQERLTNAEFRPVIEALDRHLGDWLRERGWSTETCN
ncbi:MAG: hypothetical protein IT337_12060, partial [Thermomicrobiales bacterium]|nr:hypothetical protein [Thermomicrobiales bacterium]